MSNLAIREEYAKNKSQLQAIVSISISGIDPSTISVSSPSPTNITLSAKQIYSVQPSRPLTLSTWRTPLDDATSLTWILMIKSVADSQKTLCTGGLPSKARRIHWAQPEERDFRDQMSFITVPSLESGESFSMTRQFPMDSVLLEREKEGCAMPEPGEEFTVQLRSECHVEWWNWGSLQGDLREKKFINLPHPSVSGRRKEEYELGDQWVLGYGWNLDWEDEEGDEMIYFELQTEEPGLRIKFCE